MAEEIKLIGGKYWIKAKMWVDGTRICLKFGFARPLIEEIRVMEGARWNPELRFWSVKDSRRNRFQLDFLMGKNPYAWYEQPLVEHISTRPLFKHQLHMTRQIRTYKQTVLSCEMGTGKTLAAIEAMEVSGFKDWLWIGPKSALSAVDLEMFKWKSRVIPVFMTYDRLKDLVAHWPADQDIPRGVVFDESSRLKNPTSQRSMAALKLAEMVRERWGREGYVIEMTGSPAPKSPVDWWHQAEVACPGFLKEGSLDKFRKRLGLIVEKTALTGGTYPHLVTWFDDERKCKRCGEFKDHVNHNPDEICFLESTADFHAYEPSTNEVANLYNRMAGLTLVYFKKECLDLPEKQYRIIECKAKPETLNAARLIAASAPNTITGLTLLRELSDGFQYQSVEIGRQSCPRCAGSGITKGPVFTGEGIEGNPEALAIMEDDEIDPLTKQQMLANMGVGWEEREHTCPACEGATTVPLLDRTTVQVPCPKEDALASLLDIHEDDGRLVVYGGFTGTIERIVSICRRLKWDWIRVDGRGWDCSWGARNPREMLLAFQDKGRKIDRLVFIGQPSSAGMGLTLTESCEIVYYSNDFNAESRIQSEDRIHRPGMDVNRGALITDLVHLPSDLHVINNLKAKRRLQDLSLGQFMEAQKMHSEERVT